MINERLEVVLAWCKRNKIGSENINLFDRQYRRKLSKKVKGATSDDKGQIKGSSYKG